MWKMDKEFTSYVYGNLYSREENVITGDEGSITVNPGDTLYITPKRQVFSVIFEFSSLQNNLLISDDGTTYSLTNASFVGILKEK